MSQSKRVAQVRRGPVLWVGVALIALALGVLLSPQRVVASLPTKAENLRELLEKGIVVVRWAFLSAAVLGIASALWWRLKPREVMSKRMPWEARDWWISGVLLLSGAGLRAVTIGSSLWWDELTTLVVVVRKGVPAILTWSANGNNHVLNSALIWVTGRVVGEGEIQARLPAYLFGALLPLMVFLAWRSLLNRRIAALAGVGALLHFSLHMHATEARGYAEAVFCIWLAQALLVRVIAQPTRANISGYISCCVAGFGFLPVAILVPVSHGLLAAIMWLRGLMEKTSEGDRDAWKTVWFSSTWATAIGLIGFGLPIPQMLAYAKQGAVNDHMLLSMELIRQTAGYLAGGPSVPAALVILSVCGIGWAAGPAARGMRVACLGPAALAALWLLAPHGRFSPRLFFFILPTVVMGVALASEFLMRRRQRLAPVLVGLTVFAWVALMSPLYWRRLTIGNPNLKDLAKRSSSSTFVLLGGQADVNASFYFRRASFFNSWPETEEQMQMLHHADMVVQGYRTDKTVHQRELAALGFSVSENLESWNDTEHLSFLVYRRGVAGGPTGAENEATKGPGIPAGGD